MHIGVRIGEAANPGPAEAQHTRGRRPKTQDVIVLNTSGIPQLESALKHYKSGGKQAAVILAQEHHAGNGLWTDLQLKARGMHWKVQGAPAAQEDSGTYTAGTCVATRYINMGLPPGWKPDISPAGSPGRLGVAWIEGMIRGGMLVVSVYLWHSEGMSARNREIMDEVGL